VKICARKGGIAFIFNIETYAECNIPAALSRERHFEGRKYGILKIGRFWQIDVCIAERVGS